MKTLDQNLLDEIVRRLVAEFHPEQIILFGSHAWGTPTEDSDIDLCVIVSESNERPIKRMQRAFQSLGNLRFPKDILVKTIQEIDTCKSLSASLTYRILLEGKRIYERKTSQIYTPMVEESK